METFVLIMIVILPSGQYHDYVIESGIKSAEECVSIGNQFETLNGGGVAWECMPESDK